MKTEKKIVLKAVLVAFILFTLINASWYVWRTVKYGSYTKGMERMEPVDFSTWIVPRYTYTDAEDYDYLVKYPEYLSFTGNLTVGLPATWENPFTDFIVIWPKLFGGYEYGAAVTVDNVSYQIYINADGSAVDSKDQEVAEKCQETINDLLHRAKEMWNLN